MNFRTLAFALVCAAAAVAFGAAETYRDLPSVQNDYWNTTIHPGIAVDTATVTLATFATGSTTVDADALGAGEEDLWFVPFSYFKYFTAPGPLDSRDPTGMFLFFR